MGTTISVGFYAPEQLRAKAFVDILVRLVQAEGASIGVRLDNGGVRERGRDAGEVQLDTSRPIAHLRQIAETTAASTARLSVDFGYHCVSGRDLALSLLLRGAAHGEGWYEIHGGSLELSFVREDIVAGRTSDAQLQPDEVATSELDSRELFERACGLGDEAVQPFRHAAMYVEAGWPLPDECLMMYHPSAIDFARDLKRIYVGRRVDVRPVSVYAEEDASGQSLTDDPAFCKLGSFCQQKGDDLAAALGLAVEGANAARQSRQGKRQLESPGGVTLLSRYGSFAVRAGPTGNLALCGNVALNLHTVYGEFNQVLERLF